MAKTVEQSSERSYNRGGIALLTRDRVWGIIVGRLVLLAIMVVASIFWNNGRLDLNISLVPRGLVVILLATVFSSISYALLLIFNDQLRRQVSLQLLIDVALLSILVWTTGDAQSPYITLYMVLICIGGIFLGSRFALLLATTCAFIFTAISVASHLYMIPRFGRIEGIGLNRIVQIVGFHDIAFFVVGLLTAKLADRQIRAYDQLREAAQSIASLKALHERVLQSIRSGLVTTTLGGEIILFNNAAQEITGYTADQMRGKNISILLGDISIPIRHSLDAAKRGEHQPRFETEFLTPDGFGIKLGYGVSPLSSEIGETQGLIFTFQDLTEMRAMEENIRRKDRLAAVGRVAAGLAHEIRNPLGAMRGSIQVLHAGFPPESSNAQLMNIVLRESDRLNSIITNFLLYARPKVGELVETDIAAMLRDSLTLLRHSPDIQSFHRIETAIPEESLLAFADQEQLKQVFWNLSRNALQSMPDGGVLSISLHKEGDYRLQIIFSDTGCGMSAAQVERLFEPFSESKTGGTGLGLSIVYQIVRDHNGTVNVKSLEGKGTTITIDLPLEKVRVKTSATAGSYEKMLN